LIHNGGNQEKKEKCNVGLLSISLMKAGHIPQRSRKEEIRSSAKKKNNHQRPEEGVNWEKEFSARVVFNRDFSGNT